MQNVADKFKPLIKKSFVQYVNEIVSDKIKNALNSGNDNSDESETSIVENIEHGNDKEIITTAEELQSYYIIKSILGDTTDIERITYKDTVSYFSVLIDNKVTRWICRIYLKENIKYLIIPNGENNEKYTIGKISDIYSLSEILKKRTLELI